MSVRQAKEEIDAAEFRNWNEFALLEAEEGFESEQHTPSIAYLKQIAAEVRRAFSKNPASVKLHHMDLEFRKQKKTKAKTTVPVDPEAKLIASKSAWLGWAGVRPEE